MDIIGIIVVLLLPYMAGYILKSLVNKKEISQIETYLTGFFFVFLLQGVVISAGYLLLKKNFNEICTMVGYSIIATVAVFLIVLLINIIIRIIRGKGEGIYHAKLRRSDWILIAIMTLMSFFIAFRVYDLLEYLRTDIMLPTVRTTLATNTIYEYNPIISQQFTLGMINSKKIITLPVYYAALCRIFGLSETNLLYLVATLQTLVVTFISCMLFIMPVLKNRRKSQIFGIFLMALILSGDYFSGSMGAMLLWNGYSGEAIVAGAMLPYLMFVLTDWYRAARGDNGEFSLHDKIVYCLKTVLCMSASVFITGITTGILLLIIEFILLGVACLVRFRKEEGEK